MERWRHWLRWATVAGLTAMGIVAAMQLTTIAELPHTPWLESPVVPDPDPAVRERATTIALVALSVAVVLLAGLPPSQPVQDDRRLKRRRDRLRGAWLYLGAAALAATVWFLTALASYAASSHILTSGST